MSPAGIKEVTIKLRDDNYLKAYREIIIHWGYSSIEEFIEEEIKTFVESTLEDNWDSFSKDVKESKKISRRIAEKYKIPVHINNGP